LLTRKFADSSKKFKGVKVIQNDAKLIFLDREKNLLPTDITYKNYLKIDYLKNTKLALIIYAQRAVVN